LAALSPRSLFTARLFIRLFIAPFGAAMTASAAPFLFNAFPSREPGPTPHRVRGRLSLGNALAGVALRVLH